MTSRRLFTSIMETGFELGEAAVNTAVTISARAPILARHLVSPSAEGWTEWAGACSEKVEAAWNGAAAAASTWHSVMVNALFSPPTPLGFACDTVDIMRAGLSPAHACVRANARRLGAGDRL